MYSSNCSILDCVSCAEISHFGASSSLWKDVWLCTVQCVCFLFLFSSRKYKPVEESNVRLLECLLILIDDITCIYTGYYDLTRLNKQASNPQYIICVPIRQSPFSSPIKCFGKVILPYNQLVLCMQACSFSQINQHHLKSSKSHPSTTNKSSQPLISVRLNQFIIRCCRIEIYSVKLVAIPISYDLTQIVVYSVCKKIYSFYSRTKLYIRLSYVKISYFGVSSSSLVLK